MLRKDAQGLPQRSEGICTKGIMSLKRPCLACKMSKPLMSEGLGELKWACPLCSLIGNSFGSPNKIKKNYCTAAERK